MNNELREEFNIQLTGKPLQESRSAKVPGYFSRSSQPYLATGKLEGQYKEDLTHFELTCPSFLG